MIIQNDKHEMPCTRKMRDMRDLGYLKNFKYRNFFFQGFGSPSDNMDNPGYLQFYLFGPLGTQPDFFFIFILILFAKSGKTILHSGSKRSLMNTLVFCFPLIGCFFFKYLMLGVPTPPGKTTRAVRTCNVLRQGLYFVYCLTTPNHSTVGF